MESIQTQAELEEKLAAERLERKKEQMWQRLHSADPSLSPDGIITIFDFTLADHVTAENKLDQRVDGLCALTKEALLVYENGKRTKEIKLSEADEFKITPGVGSVTADCILNGSDYLICRSDSSRTAEYAAVMKRINKFKKTGEFSFDYMKDLTRFCEKCGRPLPPGSSVCPHCVDKKGVMKRLWQIALPYKWYLAVSVVLFFAITGVNLLTPYINRILVDDFIKTESPESVLLWQFALVIISLAAVHIVSQLLGIVRSRVLVITSNKVIVKLREMVFSKIQQMSISRISKRTAGELMNRVNGDTSQIQNFITGLMPDLVQRSLILISVSVMLFVYDWRLALLILFPAPLVAMSFKYFWGFIHPLYGRSWNIYSKSNTILHDIFSGIRVVKAFGMEKRESDRFDEVSQEYRDITIRNERIWATIWPWLNFFMGIGSSCCSTSETA